MAHPPDAPDSTDLPVGLNELFGHIFVISSQLTPPDGTRRYRRERPGMPDCADQRDAWGETCAG
jgi:hypothetical protein